MKLDIKDFKAEIPKSIGEIVSVKSSIEENEVKSWEWIFLGIILPIIGWLTLLALGMANIPMLYIFLLIFPISGWLFYLVKSSRKNYCFYVGQNGFAVFRILKEKKEFVLEQECLFDNLTDLIFSQTRNYINGQKTGTNYWFDFFTNEKKIYSVKGSYGEDENGIPIRKKVYKISALLDIENCWTSYKLPKIIDEIDKNGFVRFKTVNKVIELALDYIKVNEVIIKKEEIRSLSISEGLFIIETNRTTKGFLKGYYRLTFDINQIANQKCFIALCNEIFENLFQSTNA